MITKEEIENLATLSKLYVTESDILKLQKELEQMIDFAQGVNNTCIDTDTVNEPVFGEYAMLREDKIKVSYPACEVLSNAPLKDDGYFIVRKSE